MRYFEDLNETLGKTEVKDRKGKALPFIRAVDKIVGVIIKQGKKGNNVILIGNGGSASIASHISTDFLKNCRVPAVAFNDTSLITCLSNDLGYEHVFQVPVKMLAKRGDILFSISSSGRSKNILNATAEAKKRGCFIATLSGFDKNNPLRKMGEINFYVPSRSYGFVEISHLAICHLIADNIQDHGHIPHRQP
ncbi:MAG: SIS domain-containing protein [Candidatus Omnitrophica bacterium]|nr:SIS domain-containing protein [Candidatus Omnitrophota bacterium]